MKIGVPLSNPGQSLVAATPDTTQKLCKLGYQVLVQRGAGEAAKYTDEQYANAGAELVDAKSAWGADIVLALDAPTDSQIEMLHEGAYLISRLAPARSPELLDKLKDAKVSALAMDAVPRISRAQAMDVLSSQANVAGYRAIIEAANAYGRLFTGQVTAAGKMPPARVYVIGAGVAGLAAIGTANSMGAEVSATDVRPEVAEQVQSMGARFVALPNAQQESTDGYAKAMDEDQEKVSQALYAKQAAVSDIVITTANVPGRKAPILLTDEAIAGMAPGSVIVDMGAASGGNTTQTVPGEKVVTDNGVTIIGYTDLAGRLPAQSSQLYGQNVVNLLKLMTPEKDGAIKLDLEDQVIRGITVTSAGEIMWPPPKISVSAAPGAQPAAQVETPEQKAEREAKEAAAAALKAKRRVMWIGLAAVILAALVLATPISAAGNYMVFALAVVVGFYVITNVTHSLHTPLMSVTNAISGIILVGAILQIGSENLAVTICSFIAIVVASINIFGGFKVTGRMLKMFQKG